MKKLNVNILTGGGGSPAEPASIHYAPCEWTTQNVRKQSQEVVLDYEIVQNYEQSSARRGRPRSFAQARALAFSAKGGEPAGQQGFTMAEILLSLTIIGVVAAITLPSLTGNINERTWNTQRKSLYARFSQAIALMPALNGYGTLVEGNDSTSAEDTAAETFVTDGLAKVLKINNICDSEHLADCGITSKITPLSGGSYFSLPQTLISYNDAFSGTFNTTGNDDNGPGGSYVYSQLDTKVAAFETVNGESIAVYYNPYCLNNSHPNETYFTQPDMCANFIYDLNGSKGPNTVGKDIGAITAMYPSDSVVVAPMPNTQSLKRLSYVDAISACKNQNIESRLPNKDELASMFYNKKLFFNDIVMFQVLLSSTWASTSRYPEGIRILYFTTGRLHTFWRNGTVTTWCIQR